MALVIVLVIVAIIWRWSNEVLVFHHCLSCSAPVVELSFHIGNIGYFSIFPTLMCVIFVTKLLMSLHNRMCCFKFSFESFDCWCHVFRFWNGLVVLNPVFETIMEMCFHIPNCIFNMILDIMGGWKVFPIFLFFGIVLMIPFFVLLFVRDSCLGVLVQLMVVMIADFNTRWIPISRHLGILNLLSQFLNSLLKLVVKIFFFLSFLSCGSIFLELLKVL